MATREFKQIPSNLGNYITIVNTVYIYPIVDIERALAQTSVSYTYDGTNIICSTVDDLKTIIAEIIYQTLNSQPVGNAGYSIGVGSWLKDFGKNLYFKLPDGTVFVKWRLVKLITPQTQAPDNVIPVPGNSPVEVTGFVTLATAYGQTFPPWMGTNLDPVYIARLG